MLTTILIVALHSVPMADLAVQRGYENGSLVPITTRETVFVSPSGERIHIESASLPDLYDLVENANRDGFEIKLSFGFRTHGQQKILKKRNGHLAATPGYSNHQLGVAIDILGTIKSVKGVQKRTSLYYWLRKNSKKYNWSQPLAHEPWHWVWEPSSNSCT